MKLLEYLKSIDVQRYWTNSTFDLTFQSNSDDLDAKEIERRIRVFYEAKRIYLLNVIDKPGYSLVLSMKPKFDVIRSTSSELRMLITLSHRPGWAFVATCMMILFPIPIGSFLIGLSPELARLPSFNVPYSYLLLVFVVVFSLLAVFSLIPKATAAKQVEASYVDLFNMLRRSKMPNPDEDFGKFKRKGRKARRRRRL